MLTLELTLNISRNQLRPRDMNLKTHGALEIFSFHHVINSNVLQGKCKNILEACTTFLPFLYKIMCSIFGYWPYPGRLLGQKPLFAQTKY